jgi:ubiquinone/menaquinone biosynthesis C-methylase UbiE
MEYDTDNIQVKTIHETIDFFQKHVLEIGCGNGETSLHLARGTRTYTAIDPDRAQINLARNLTQKKGPHDVVFQVGSGQFLEFEADFFDIVLFTLSLHHQDSRIALGEAFRVLKPGGSLLVVEPLANGEFQQFFHLFNDETPALGSAVTAVQTSQFDLVKKENFHTIVLFENIQDLLVYDFDRDRIGPEDDQKILDHLYSLKKKSSRHPKGTLVLKDELQIFLLKKPYPLTMKTSFT